MAAASKWPPRMCLATLRRPALHGQLQVRQRAALALHDRWMSFQSWLTSVDQAVQRHMPLYIHDQHGVLALES